MSFGALVASGGRLLPDDIFGHLVEIRVEQQLDDATTFALRFEDDLDGGEPILADRPELQPETLLTIAAPTPDGLVGLVHGPVTQVVLSFATGGAGSWIEVRGSDRRIELDRVHERRTWSGRASTALAAILDRHGFVPDVADTTKVYAEGSGTLNQGSSDLQLVRRLARQEGFAVWITVDLETAADRVRVVETAHVKPSPPRPDGAAGLPAPPIALVPTTSHALRVTGSGTRARTCTQLQVSFDVERPTAFDGFALSDTDLSHDPVSADDDQPAVEPGGRRLTDVAPAARVACLAAPGDAAEVAPRARALLIEAGWFVEATSITTAHMLGGVLVPHDVVTVEGVGSTHSGAYQVAAATHVITAADHYMTLELRRNALGAAPTGRLP